jgi:hypothetical protein
MQVQHKELIENESNIEAKVTHRNRYTTDQGKIYMLLGFKKYKVYSHQ